jgi:hypothetical protein
MQRIRFFLLAPTLTVLSGAPAHALVYLTSYNFASNSLPTIYSDDNFSGPYRLRAKIAGTFHATDLWNNNLTQLQGVPGTGTYIVDLYWVKYSSDFSTILEIGPFNTQTITISAPNQPPVPTISVDGYSPGATISRPNGGVTNITVRYSATDANGNLSGIRYNVWNATTNYFDNGGGRGFVAQSGGSGQFVKTVTLSTDGEWYFWADAADASGAYASTGAWGSGLHLSVQQAPLTVLVSASNTQLGQTTTLTGTATDPNGNLQAIISM